jgi:anaerobic selenocysteine-containing dehydrogenase
LGVDYDWIQKRFASKKLMESKGIPVSRWFDGVLEAKDNIDQPDNVRAMVFWGHAPNSQTRLVDMKKAMEKLDLLVVIDPYPTVSAVMPDRKDGICLLPAATQFETSGSVTASNRSLQWREKMVEPLFECKTDHKIMYLFAKKFGFGKELTKNIKVNGTEPFVDDILREINKAAWTIGYTGQSPERLKLHMANQHTFDGTTLRANGGPCDGEYYGLPWPCYGTAEMKHPGTPILYDPSKPPMEGGFPPLGIFIPRFYRRIYGFTRSITHHHFHKEKPHPSPSGAPLAGDSYAAGVESFGAVLGRRCTNVRVSARLLSWPHSQPAPPRPPSLRRFKRRASSRLKYLPIDMRYLCCLPIASPIYL